jgi:hypothetical protein
MVPVICYRSINQGTTKQVFMSSSVPLQNSSLVGFQISICTCSAGKALNFLYFISTWHIENCQMQRYGKRLEWYYRKTAERFSVSHSVIVRLKHRVNQTRSVKKDQRTGKTLKTTAREDWLLKSLARQQPFITANMLRSRWIVNWRISRRTVNRRLNNARCRARIPIKHPLLPILHKIARLQWGTWPYGMEYQVVAESALVGWKSFFVESSWWPRPRMETKNHSIFTGTYCGHSCIWWRWYYCLEMLFFKLYVLDGTLTGQRYRHHILRPLVVLTVIH